MLADHLTQLVSRLVENGLLQVLPADVEPLQRYTTLDPASRRMFRRAAILLPLVRCSLRLRGYGKTFTSSRNALNSKLGTRETCPKQAKGAGDCRMVRPHCGIRSPNTPASRVADSVVAAS